MPESKGGHIELTDDQRHAVQWPGGELLVAAAAGSGKTAVLVERFVWLVTNGKADPENLPALTFTEKAAEQLRRRIRRRLEEAGVGKQILRSLDGAYISTIHGFCRRLLRENYQLAGIDPSFLVIPEEESGLLKRKALDDVFEDIFAGVLDDELLTRVRDLCNAHGGKEFEDGVKKQILDFHDWLMKQVDPEEWLKEIDVDNEQDLIGTGRFKAYLDLLSDRVNRMCSEYTALAPWASDTKKDGSIAKYAENIQTILALLEQIDGIDPYESPGQYFTLIADLKHPGMHGTSPQELKDISSSLRENCFNKLTKLLGPPPDEGFRELAASYRDFNILAGLTKLFVERYRRLKTRRWGLDFDDLQHKLMSVLLEKPDVGKAYRERFTHLLVDEFQDNNRLQEAILRDLCPPAGLFMVGDSKQAIYRFRGAEPLVFLETEERLAGSKGIIRLDLNFRSRPSVCSTVNNLFAPLFSGGPAEIDYTEGHALSAHRESATGGDPLVEFHLIDRINAARDFDPEDEEEADDREILEIEADSIARKSWT